jgi:hypothetical protein
MTMIAARTRIQKWKKSAFGSVGLVRQNPYRPSTCRYKPKVGSPLVRNAWRSPCPNCSPAFEELAEAKRYSEDEKAVAAAMIAQMSADLAPRL